MTNKEVIQKFSELDYRLRHIVVNRCEEMPITNVGKIVIYDSQIFFWNGTTYERILTEDDLEGLVTELELAWLTQDIQDALVNANAPDASNPYATFNDILALPAPITVVANYSALPDPTTVTGEFYWAEASQGTSWLPGSLGGTYYNAGMYYSNGVSWSYLETPYQATQLEVNAGTVDNKFVTPLTGQVAYAFKPGITGGQTIIGGTQVTDALTLQGTSGNGTLTDKAIRVLVGNNGSTEAINVTNNGYVNVGQRIYLGTATGAGRINLPDSGTTSTDGIHFGTGIQLYRLTSGTLSLGGNQAFAANVYTTPNFAGSIAYSNYSGISMAPNALTGSSATSALSITQTWNTTGNPTAIFLNVTNTASGASANLMDLQIGGVSQFRVSKPLTSYSATSNGVSIQTLTSGSGLITSLANAPADPVSGISAGANFGFNGSASNFYGMGLGATRNSKFDMWFQTGATNGGGYRFYIGTTEHVTINNIGSLGLGVSSIDASAKFQINSTTQGGLFPRMTNAQRLAIASPSIGLEVYCTDAVEGKYIYKSTGWTFVI